MKRPSFQFYPGDWSSNPNLRRCTFAERGIWLDVMCLMHDQDEYGVLRWPLKEVAEAVGCKVSDLQALLRKGVLKGAEEQLAEPYVYIPRSGRKSGPPVTLIDAQPGPIWYSSRMVKDEYVRILRGDTGGNGDAPDASPKKTPKPSPKPPLGEAKGEDIPPSFGPRDARTPAAPSSSFSSSTSLDESANALSARGAVGIALKAGGIDPMSINLADPRIDALIAAGATPDHWEGLAREAVKTQKAKPIAWVLAVLPERLKTAANTPKGSRHAGFASKDYRQGVDADGTFTA